MNAKRGARERWAVFGWGMYDLANTIFFLLVVTIVLPEHLFELSHSHRTLAYTYVPTMLIAAALSPALGVVIDRMGRARDLTFAITLVCCVSTALLGLPKAALGVSLLYACARFTYEMASVPYNALLPSIAGEGGIGGVSGFGVALGYLGNIVALALLKLFHVESRGGIYVFAAVLFLLFTLPLQFLVREPPPVKPGHVAWRDVVKAFATTGASLRRQFGRKPMRNYLVGTLLVCDSINTVLVQVALYAGQREGLGLTREGVNNFMMAIQISAIAGGFLFGHLADRTSGRATTLWATALLGIGMATAQFLPGFWARIVAMSVFGGAGLAGVWAAGRHWLVELVPRDEVGEAFGFYGLAQRASVVTLYPFTWLVDLTQSYALPVGLLLAVLVAGFALLVRTPARRAS